MDMQEIDVTIDKNGNVQVQVRGVKGAACLDLTRTLEESLGGQVVEREMTPEALEGDQPVREEIQIKKKGAA